MCAFRGTSAHTAVKCARHDPFSFLLICCENQIAVLGFTKVSLSGVTSGRIPQPRSEVVHEGAQKSGHEIFWVTISPLNESYVQTLPEMNVCLIWRNCSGNGTQILSDLRVFWEKKPEVQTPCCASEWLSCAGFHRPWLISTGFLQSPIQYIQCTVSVQFLA